MLKTKQPITFLKNFKQLVKEIDAFQPLMNSSDPYGWFGEDGCLTIAMKKNVSQKIKALIIDIENTDENQSDLLNEKALAYDNQRYSFLEIAIKYNFLEIAIALLNNPYVEIENDGLLAEACKAGHLPMIQALLGRNDIDNNQHHDRTLLTPLTTACMLNKKDVVELLVSYPSVEVNKPSKHGTQYTPLTIACANCNPDIVNILLSQKDIEINLPTLSGTTPLLFACGPNQLDNGANNKLANLPKDRLETVKLLLQCDDIDINLASHAKNTPLIRAAQYNHFDVLKVLHEQDNIIVNLQNDEGMTALMYACKVGNVEMVQLLLSNDDIDLDLMNIQRQTALKITTKATIVELLQEALANKNNPAVSQFSNNFTYFGQHCESVKYEQIIFIDEKKSFPISDSNCKKNNNEPCILL